MPSLYTYGSLLSLVIGVIWIAFGKSYIQLNLPFSYSGWLTPVWFLPAIIAAFAQVQFKVQTIGLIFLMEALAALISGAFGPLGWVSFHFGLFQGLLGEVAFLSTKNIYAVGVALCVADLVLMRFHPKLTALQGYSRNEWFLHGFGVIVSTLLLCFFLTFGPATAHAFDQECMSEFDRHVDRHEEILVLTDYDGTIVDTDIVLLSEVIPQSIQQVAETHRLSPSSSLSNFLGENQRQVLELPKSYTEKAWRDWGFPVDQLPEAMGQTSGERLKAFWDIMRQKFRPYFEGKKQIPENKHFLEFRDWVNRKYGSQLEWKVLTARTEKQINPVRVHIVKLDLTQTPESAVIHRGESHGVDSNKNADYKVENLLRIRREFNGPIIFLEDDIQILRRAQLQLGSSILFLRADRKKLSVY